MLKYIKCLTAALACTVLFGCAHPITMTPDLAKIQATGVTPVAKTVGYHISDANRGLEVTTDGGGGDKIRYFPYKDIEAGLYKALSEVFSSVSKINDPRNVEELRESGISILVAPEIRTTSSSPSLLTWPPTKFSVTLTCSIVGIDGRLIQNLSVTGEGAAEFDDFKSKVSLAAVRASNDALTKLIIALGDSAELRK